MNTKRIFYKFKPFQGLMQVSSDKENNKTGLSEASRGFVLLALVSSEASDGPKFPDYVVPDT